MTLIGALQYFEGTEHPLFEHLELPAGVDKETFIYACIQHGGEFELLYPNLDYMQNYAIGQWSRMWSRTFTKWKEALDLKYNAIENYDRFEEWTDDAGGNAQTSSNEMVSAFNSDAMRDDSSSDNQSAFKNNAKHTGHLHGNIGVTTSQQMLESELDIVKWNLYEHMADLFLKDFTVPIY